MAKPQNNKTTAAASIKLGVRLEKPRGVEWLLVIFVTSYAVILLIGPILAIMWGALEHGIIAFLREMISSDALKALRLTLILSISTTIINSVMGLCIAFVLVRDRFIGRHLINGLVDLPFAVSPVIVGFMFILLFGRGGWLSDLATALGIKIAFAFPGMLLATTFISLPFVIREVIGNRLIVTNS